MSFCLRPSAHLWRNPRGCWGLGTAAERGADVEGDAIQLSNGLSLMNVGGKTATWRVFQCAEVHKCGAYLVNMMERHRAIERTWNEEAAEVEATTNQKGSFEPQNHFALRSCMGHLYCSNTKARGKFDLWPVTQKQTNSGNFCLKAFYSGKIWRIVSMWYLIHSNYFQTSLFDEFLGIVDVFA